MEESTKDLAYYRKNAEEDYMTTPISVLRYITELEEKVRKSNFNKMMPTSNIPELGTKGFNDLCSRMFGGNSNR